MANNNAAEAKDKAVLTYPGGSYDMPIIKATNGNDGIALGKLLQETGYVTLDPGYVNTGSTLSNITYIDGANGILRYRGYPIEELAEKATFNVSAVVPRVRFCSGLQRWGVIVIWWSRWKGAQPAPMNAAVNWESALYDVRARGVYE